MNELKHAKFYLPSSLRKRAAAGQHNFLNKVANVLCQAGFDIEYLDPDLADQSASGYSLFHMIEPFAQNSLTIRRVYFYPFWQIERSHERWKWEVAQTDFTPDEIQKDQAKKFYRAWQRRLFRDPLKDVGKDGFVYVPLQGLLLSKRSFQYCSPLEMIEYVLHHAPNKKVIAALHPREKYSDEELELLQQLVSRYDQLSLTTGNMEHLLARCDYVVTQNSSAAFSGYFFGKPCVLFGKIDFHHIGADVHKLGVASAFETVSNQEPEYDKYIWWFLQHMSINAGRPEAEDKIKARLDALGWPV